jgi:hypothetical protein
MNCKLSLLAFAACVAASCAQAGNPPAANAPRIGHLQCGGASLVASTVYLDVDDQDRQTLTQSITLTSPGRGEAVALPLEGKLLNQPFLKHVTVLDAAVTGWACVNATDGKPYVYLTYTCTESPSRPACEGDDREWVRLFDIQGKPLNAGFPHDGERTPDLMKKLGLGHYVTDGVSLNDISD